MHLFRNSVHFLWSCLRFGPISSSSLLLSVYGYFLKIIMNIMLKILWWTSVEIY